MTNGVSTTIGSSGGMSARRSPLDMIHLVLRGVQFIFAIIVIGTIGNVINSDSKVDGCYDDDFGDFLCFYTPASFKYNMFAGAWTFIVVAYFVVASLLVPSLYHLIPALAIDALSVIIWFAAWVSVAVWLGATDSVYFTVYTNSAHSELSAGTAFGAFTDLAFVATLVINLLRHRSNRGPANTGVPMQQHPGAV